MSTTDRHPQPDTATDPTGAAPITYRPLDPTWGDADELTALRALRTQRWTRQEQETALILAADARERARRHVPTMPRHRAGRDAWRVLPV